MLMIIGIGGTIEYLKSNDTAKELPDKVIMAIDKLLDDTIEEEKWIRPIDLLITKFDHNERKKNSTLGNG